MFRRELTLCKSSKNRPTRRTIGLLAKKKKKKRKKRDIRWMSKGDQPRSVIQRQLDDILVSKTT